jgi:hypothetical protein
MLSQKGRKFNAMHSVTEILSPSSQSPASGASESDHKLTVHAENARLHTARLSVEFSEDNRMKTEPHPPYSPNITPSNFYRFGLVTGCLAGRSFVDAEERFEAGRGVLGSNKIDFASSVSRVDGPAEEMYSDERRVHRINQKILLQTRLSLTQ